MFILATFFNVLTTLSLALSSAIANFSFRLNVYTKVEYHQRAPLPVT